jgi:hypothetical protein
MEALMDGPDHHYALVHNACAVCGLRDEYTVDWPQKRITIWFATKHDTLCPSCFAWLGRMLRVVSVQGRYV